MNISRREVFLSLAAMSALKCCGARSAAPGAVAVQGAAAAPVPWIQGASLALQVAGMFQHKDDGLGAMLSGLKQLSELNISLSRDILSKISALESQLDELPETMRRALRESDEHKVRAQTEAIVAHLKYV